MTMKQTQTKMFDFSDVGLDFCAGSKNLFPTVFKKMLAQGYNPQTVSSVSVSGNQVIFTYGTNHGYVADRVLKVDSGTLASINGGEFWIDSVTSNTVTMTIDGVSGSISGGFGTKIASLGWSLEYEAANIHVYKMKYLDNTDRYVRLCYQDNVMYRNRVSVCIGKTFDVNTGFITDANALAETRSCLTPVEFAWEFQQIASNAYNTSTYMQGLSVFGKGMVVGSLYHSIFMCNTSASNTTCHTNAIIPVQSTFSELNEHLMIGEWGSVSGNGGARQIEAGRIYINQLSLSLTASSNLMVNPPGDTFLANYYSASVQSFNTTAAFPLALYERSTGQHIGYAKGLVRVAYTYTSPPISTTIANLPRKTKDVDLANDFIVHGLSNASGNFYALGCPMEAING